MARPMRPDGNEADWEVCEDNGFVYKRRRRHLSLLVGRLPADSAEELRRSHRSRKKRCLNSIRDRYLQEVEQWEDLSASLLRLASPPPEAASEAPTSSVASPRSFHLSLPAIDGLILELDAQEAILRKISDLCDCMDLFCQAQEDRLTQSLLDLPIWGALELSCDLCVIEIREAEKSHYNHQYIGLATCICWQDYVVLWRLALYDELSSLNW
ncbi:hypothetical protein IEQ34_008970 [Dendrobium chrysotoxum]|uniref:Uncharacterized protein n=1 Tax=Dendrobium chrysotoxum TaxID=161865 RepID=A0AAV7GZ98_DENCH|nr:hypothetical protein IEQ34_008970 [Dendrobium chrysotoxum]